MTARAHAPSQAPEQCEESRPPKPDFTIIVIVFVALLFMVPSNRVVAAIGAFGTPASLFALVMLGIWGIARLSGSTRLSRRCGVLHIVILVLAIATVASYVAGMNGVLSAKEANAADRGLLALFSWLGIFLLAADGILSRRRLESLLRWVAGFLAFDAIVALSQYILGRDLLAGISPPGLAVNYAWGIDERSDFIRVVGTALHAIEFGVVQAMGLALVLHWALYSPSRRERNWWWAGCVAMIAALPLTISRSAMVSVAVVLLTMVPTWPRQRRRRAYLAIPFVIVAVRLAFPGVLGTILSLFSYFNDDPSTTSRTHDYGQVLALIRDSPVFGRGVGTLLPELYFILDNQYLMALVTTGLLGLAALIAVVVTGLGVAVLTRRRIADSAGRDLVQSMLAGLLVGSVSMALFDGFSFPQATGMFFLLLGVVAAVSRQNPESRAKSEAQEAPLRPAGLHRRVLISLRRHALPVAVAMAVFASLAPWVGAGGRFVSDQAYLLHDRDVHNGLFTEVTDLGDVASLLTTWLDSAQGRELVNEQGGNANYVSAQGEGSLAKPTETVGRGPVVRVRADAADSKEVIKTQAVVADVMAKRLAELQSEVGAPEAATIVARRLTTSVTPAWTQGARHRSLAGSFIMACLCGALVSLIMQIRRERRDVSLAP